jgi:DNA polymerase III gamma/tau subunit
MAKSLGLTQEQKYEIELFKKKIADDSISEDEKEVYRQGLSYYEGVEEHIDVHNEGINKNSKQIKTNKMTQQQQEEVNLLKELIADTSISADERMIYEDALSELMKSEKPKASTERKPKATTERKPRTTTQRKPQAPKQSKSDIELAKAEIKRRTGKTEEECESIVNEYRSLRAKSVERKKKESVASAENKDRVAKLKKDDKIISGTNEKTADAVIESTTKDVAEKIVKEIDKIEQKAEVEATKEVKKEMPKESTTEQNKVIAEKTEEKVKEIVKRKTKNIIIDTSDLLTSIAESLGRFDKDSQKEFLIKLRSDIDKLLAKFSYGGSTMGATQGFNITQSNLSSSSVNPTMFGGGGGVEVNEKYKVVKVFSSRKLWT